jgi:DNA polymerase-3 subunit gamma/tau
VDALAAGDGAGVFAVVDRVIESGHDPRRFVEDLLERLRDLLVISAVGAGRSTTVHSVLRGLPDDQLARMEGQASRFGAADLSRQADVVNAALTEMTGATSPRLQLELLCARLLLPGADDAERGLRSRLDRLERRVGVAVPEHDADAPAAPAPRSDPAAPAPRSDPAAPAPRSDSAPPAQSPPEAPGEAAGPASRAEPSEPATQAEPPPAADPAVPGALDVETIRRRWPEVLDALSRMKRATWSLISPHAQVLDYDGHRLLLGFGSAGLVGQFVRGAHQEFLRQALIEALGLDCRLEATSTDTAAPPRAAAAAQVPAPEPPPDPAPAPDEPVQTPARATADEPARDDVPPPDQPPPPDDEPPPPPDARRRTSRRAAASIRLPAEAPPVPADEPSLDDAEFQGVHLVGAPVVEQLLGGRVIEEREE